MQENARREEQKLEKKGGSMAEPSVKVWEVRGETDQKTESYQLYSCREINNWKEETKIVEILKHSLNRLSINLEWDA